MCRSVLVLILTVLCVSCAMKDGGAPDGPYLILYAFASEGELIASQMQTDTVEVQLGREVRVGSFAGKQIVLAESGIGMTNAAMSTQKLIDAYHPTTVIMTGIAGALDSAVRIGDVVVCDSWAQHDYVYVGNEETRHQEIWLYSPEHDSVVGLTSFPVDSSLLHAARSLRTDELGLDDIDGRAPILHVGGVGVTGNAFIDSRHKRSELVSNFGAVITEMESAAVVQVCLVSRVPVIVLRSASDLAGGSESVTAADEMNRFLAVAADNSAKILENLLRAIN